MAAKNVISGPLFDFMNKRKDEEISVNEMAAELGITRAQVLNGMNTLRGKGINVVAITRGHTYVLRSGKSPSARKVETPDNMRMFEEISVLTENRILLRCEDGKLYVAKEII
jgi:biotin operon repressor